jgi:hypothetical protein
MAQGLTREQLGITEAMLVSYADTVFTLSNNVQRRAGDPVRDLDFQALERQRAELGLSDGQIAQRVGLTVGQVTYIRNLEEMRRMRGNNFQRLLTLGGGKRFRVERFTAHEARFEYSDRALRLRAAMSFDPGNVRRYFESGYWQTDTLRSLIDHWSEHAESRIAVRSADATLSYGELAHRVRGLASGLAARGVRPGEVVSVQLPNSVEFLLSYLAITYMGGVMTTLYLPHREAEMRHLLGHSRAIAFVCAGPQGARPGNSPICKQ